MAFFRQQRGKDDDDNFSPPRDLGLDWDETLLDVILSPGDMLYIPRAFPHQVQLSTCEDNDDGISRISTHLTVGIETETLGLTMDNLIMCILGINDALKYKQDIVKELVNVILDIVAHDHYEHFRRAIPFGFNYADNGDQLVRRIQNLSNSVYEMKQKLGKSKDQTKRSMKVSKNLVMRAYKIFEKANEDIMRIYKSKRNILDKENWNQDQEELQRLLIKKVQRYFKQCRIDVENTNLLFAVNMGKE